MYSFAHSPVFTPMPDIARASGFDDMDGIIYDYNIKSMKAGMCINGVFFTTWQMATLKRADIDLDDLQRYSPAQLHDIIIAFEDGELIEHHEARYGFWDKLSRLHHEVEADDTNEAEKRFGFNSL